MTPQEASLKKSRDKREAVLIVMMLLTRLGVKDLSGTPPVQPVIGMPIVRSKA